MLNIDQQTGAFEEIGSNDRLFDGGAHKTMQAVVAAVEHYWKVDTTPGGNTTTIGSGQVRLRRAGRCIRENRYLCTGIDQVLNVPVRVGDVEQAGSADGRN